MSQSDYELANTIRQYWGGKARVVTTVHGVRSNLFNGVPPKDSSRPVYIPPFDKKKPPEVPT